LLTELLDNNQYVTVVTQASSRRGEWVLLAYRVPREPSAPRIAVWRKLKSHGVAQIRDGLVALPADARTVEALEWVADDILAAGGSATVWRARLTSRTSEHEVIRGMAAARALEYAALADRAQTLLDAGPVSGSADGLRRLRLLRREQRRIQRRDYFPPPERQHAQSVVKAVAARLTDSGAAAGERATEVGAS
jgi:hypothetical protein